jgi:hypothetical protein
MRVLVTAPRNEVEQALRDELSADEFKLIQMEVVEDQHPLQPSPRRAEPAITIALRIAEGVATAAAYDVLKAITLKALEVLKRKFGTGRVRIDGPTT